MSYLVSSGEGKFFRKIRGVILGYAAAQNQKRSAGGVNENESHLYSGRGDANESDLD